MSDFLKRLTGVFHWICFLISVFIAFFAVSMDCCYCFRSSTCYVEGYTKPIAEYLSTLQLILIPNVIGWLVKYIFTRNGKFLPF